MCESSLCLFCCFLFVLCCVVFYAVLFVCVLFFGYGVCYAWFVVFCSNIACVLLSCVCDLFSMCYLLLPLLLSLMC